MKKIIFILALFVMASCNTNTQDSTNTQLPNDSLQLNDSLPQLTIDSLQLNDSL